MWSRDNHKEEQNSKGSWSPKKKETVLGMKQRLTIDDVVSLTGAQQQTLREVWIPQRYDIAVSRFCVNAETDTYKWIEYAVGDIAVKSNGSVVLRDLRLTDGYVKINEGELMGQEDFSLQEPTSFLKQESLPLLNIGQMITMLHLLDKSKYHFYLLAGNIDYACEIGDFNSNLKPQLLAKSDIKDELLDVLWTTLKTIL